MKYHFIKLFFILLFFCAFHHTFAQGYHIQATIKGFADSTFVIGHYNRSHSQFVPKDTAKADSNGQVVFKNTADLPGGLYLLLFPDRNRLVEFIYSGDEKKISFSTDPADIVKNMKFTDSKENQIFYEYQQELNKREVEIATLKQENSKAATDKIKLLQEQYKTYRKKFFADHANTFTVKLLKMVSEPEIPTQPAGSTDSLWAYKYYKAHFWDNFDFSDERIIRTPFFEKKANQYFTELVPQNVDSLIQNADLVIQKASVNENIKSIIVYQIANLYENPTTLGTEGVWVHIAEKYYLSGAMGTNEDSKKRIAAKVNTLKKVLVDKKFPSLSLTDPAGKKFTVNDIPADYTIVFFYSPTCGHCKEAAPKLKEFYDKHQTDKVKVIAVATEYNPEEWKKYISNYHLESIVHGNDATQKIDFNSTFDVVTTPSIYILDKNKTIIARKLPINQLDDFFEFYRKKIKTIK